MATRARASAVFPVSIERVWAIVRHFDFPSHHINGISECHVTEGTATTVGAVRTMKWQSGETRRHRLLGLSDQYYEISWELVESHPEAEYSGCISVIKLYRITENDQTLVEWSADFSADVTAQAVKFETKSLQQNLSELRASIAKAK
eukprot:m51a1_g14546 hypothetical protein (147) ;mRNA; f:982420-983083